jgi:hypothetical protein
MAILAVKFIKLGRINSTTGSGWTAAFQNMVLPAYILERTTGDGSHFPAKQLKNFRNFEPPPVFYYRNNE